MKIVFGCSHIWATMEASPSKSPTVTIWISMPLNLVDYIKFNNKWCFSRWFIDTSRCSLWESVLPGHWFFQNGLVGETQFTKKAFQTYNIIHKLFKLQTHGTLTSYLIFDFGNFGKEVPFPSIRTTIAISSQIGRACWWTRSNLHTTKATIEIITTTNNSKGKKKLITKDNR